MRCWANYLIYGVIAILGTGQILVACGQKGDLYLPSDPAPAEQQTSNIQTDGIEDVPTAANTQ